MQAEACDCSSYERFATIEEEDVPEANERGWGKGVHEEGDEPVHVRRVGSCVSASALTSARGALACEYVGAGAWMSAWLRAFLHPCAHALAHACVRACVDD